MKSTFKCWLIANFEIILFWIAMIITGIVFLIHRDLIFPQMKKNPQPFFLIFLFLLPILFHPFPNMGGTIFKYLLLLAIHVGYSVLIIQYNIHHDQFIAVWITWVIFAISSFVGGSTARYAYFNMDEVVSWMMLYRNSKVDIFEITWKYTINRFCHISFVVAAFAYWMVGLGIFINLLP